MNRQEEPKAEQKSKTKTRKRALRWLGLAVPVLIVVVVLLLPAFVSSEIGRRIILAKINRSVEGKADFGNLSMSWWKGIEVTDISFDDLTGQTSLTVKHIFTKPHYGSLLFGSLSFGETRVDEPRVEMTVKEEPPAEATSTGQVVLAGQAAPQVKLPLKRIDLLVNNGNVKISDPKAESVEFSKINSRVNLRAPGKQTHFEVNMAVADGDDRPNVHADGRVTPDKQAGWRLEGATGDLVVEVNDLDLESLGPVFALGGVDVDAKGRISGRMKSAVKDGRIEDLTGSIKGRDLDITGEPLKGDRIRTSVLDVNVKLRSEKDRINIDNLQVHSDWGDARGSGVIPRTFESLAAFAKPGSVYALEGDFNCDLAAALSQLPRTLGLKEGVTVTSGRLTGRIETPVKDGKKYIHGSGNLAGLAGVVAGKPVALSEPVTAEVEITSTEDLVQFEKLKVASSFAKFDATGTTELLKYETEANLAGLQAELGQFITTGGYEMAGELFSKGEVASRKDRVTAAGSAVVKELRLTSKEGMTASEPEANIEFSLNVMPEQGILDVNLGKLSASLAQVSIDKGVLPLGAKAQTPMNLMVSANNVNLERLQPFAVLFASFPKDKQLAGIAESKLSVKSDGDSYRISTEASRIKNLKFSVAGKKPFEQNEVSLVADVHINPVEETYAVEKLQLTGPDVKIYWASIRQTSKAGKTKLEGQIDCEYDWAAVTALAAPILPAGLEIEGQVRDRIEFSSEYPTGERDKLLANLSTKGKLAFERAYYKGLEFSPTEVEIQVVKGLLTISPFTSQVNNGELSFAGKVDLKQTPALLETPEPIQIARNIQMNDNLSRELLVYLNPVFADAFNVGGVGNFHCERLAIPLAGAPIKNLQVIGTISADRLRLSASDLLGQLLQIGGLSLKDQELKVHPTRFVLWDGFLRYDDMQVDVGDNPFNFKGIIGLDTSLNMTVTLPYTLEGQTIRVGQENTPGRISVPLKGTIYKPEVDLGGLLEGQLRRQLEEKIFEGLDKLLK
ncbi:MAG: translocation/assembly module TamB domain-containing protein [Planctomycetota bacterium]|jgi:hypothetical protein